MSAYTTDLQDQLTRAQFEFNKISDEYTNVWGPAGELKRLEPGSPRYEAALKKYKQLKPAYDAAKQKIDSLEQKIKAERDANDTRKRNEKETNVLNESLNKTKQELQRATDLNDTAGIQAANNRITEINTALQNVGKKPQGAVGGDSNAPDLTGDQKDKLLTDYTVVTIGGVNYVAGKNTTKELYFVPPAKAGEQVVPFEDINKAKEAMIKNAGGVGKLAAALTNAGYKGDFDTNLVTAIRSYGTDMLRNYQAKNGKIPLQDVKSFIGSLGKFANAGKTSVSQSFLDRTGTDRYLESYYADMFGTAPTAEDKKNFYAQVHSMESKTRTVTTTNANGTTQVGSSLSDADYALVAANIAKTTIKNTPVDKLISSAKGGQLTNDINQLMSTASEYGVPMTAQEAMKRLAAGVGEKNYVQKQQDRIKQTAMILHPNLKEHIAAGGTVKDVTDTFARVMTNKIGTVVPDSTKDKYIMNAVSNGMNLDQFDSSLQKHPDYRYSAEAHQRATEFTNQILQSFGFGG